VFFLLNRSFDLIVQQLDQLGQTRLFTSRALREMRGLTQEVQLEINNGLLDSFERLKMRTRRSSERSVWLWKRDLEILTTFLFMRKNDGSNSPNRAESPGANKPAFAVCFSPKAEKPNGPDYTIGS
jgi:hypothetical protein